MGRPTAPAHLSPNADGLPLAAGVEQQHAFGCIQSQGQPHNEQGQHLRGGAGARRWCGGVGKRAAAGAWGATYRRYAAGAPRRCTPTCRVVPDQAVRGRHPWRGARRGATILRQGRGSGRQGGSRAAGGSGCVAGKPVLSLGLGFRWWWAGRAACQGTSSLQAHLGPLPSPGILCLASCARQYPRATGPLAARRPADPKGLGAAPLAADVGMCLGEDQRQPSSWLLHLQRTEAGCEADWQRMGTDERGDAGGAAASQPAPPALGRRPRAW